MNTAKNFKRIKKEEIQKTNFGNDEPIFGIEIELDELRKDKMKEIIEMKR
jgi:hypothetical protein